MAKEPGQDSLSRYPFKHVIWAPLKFVVVINVIILAFQAGLLRENVFFALLITAALYSVYWAIIGLFKGTEVYVMRRGR